MRRFVSILLAIYLMVSFPGGASATGTPVTDALKRISETVDFVEREEEIRATELFNAGKYPEAKKIFLALGMTEPAKECDYQWAFTQVENHHYQSALLLFGRLAETGYKNSEELLNQVKAEYVLYLLGTFSVQNYYAAYQVATELERTGYPEADQLVDYAILTILEAGIKTYQAGNYTVAYQLFSVIRPADTEEIVQYYALSRIRANMPISEEEYGILFNNLDFEDTKEVLLSGKVPAIRFLRGEWREANGLLFSLAEDGTLADALPRINPEACYWVIDDGVLKVYTEFSKTRIDDHEIRILSADRIEIFCHADGKTYTLEREVR